MNATLLAFLAPLGPFALLLLMLVAFAETGLLAGFLLPADTLLVTAGVLVAAGGLHLPVWLSLAAVSLAAVAGDQMAYLVGRCLGPGLQQGPRTTLRLISTPRGSPGLLLPARGKGGGPVPVRPLARTLTPVLAGLGGMDRRKFLLHNVVGAVGWAAVMFGGGYWLGAIPMVASNLELILLTMVAFSVLPVVASLVRARAASRSVPAVRRPPPGQD